MSKCKSSATAVKFSAVKSSVVVQVKSSKNQLQSSPSAVKSSVVVQLQSSPSTVKCCQVQISASAVKWKCCQALAVKCKCCQVLVLSIPSVNQAKSSACVVKSSPIEQVQSPSWVQSSNTKAKWWVVAEIKAIKESTNHRGQHSAKITGVWWYADKVWGSFRWVHSSNMKAIWWVVAEI